MLERHILAVYLCIQENYLQQSDGGCLQEGHARY